MERGCIHFYYGDGKGKTTAAMGLALRALGHGLPVTAVQFLKDGDSGECAVLERLGATVLAGKAAPYFTAAMTAAQKEDTRKLHDENLRRAQKLTGGMGLLVLDEAGDALQLGLLDEQLLRLVLEQRRETEIAVTGHSPVAWLVEMADYVTEMKAHRHPYARGLRARAGIEY